MFKFEYLIINSSNGKSRKIQFEDHIHYIYSTNSKGKTLLCSLVDYMLGSSDSVLTHQGLDKGIVSFECLLKFGDENLYLMRESNNFFYRRNKESMYKQITRDLYVDKITLMYLNGETTQLDKFFNVFNWNLSHRSLNFINFLDQNGMGNLKNVFTKSRETKYLFKFKDILNYVFNNNNIEQIISKQNILEEKKKMLLSLEKNANNYDFYFNIINKELKKLSIPNDLSITESKQLFELYVESYVRPDLKSSERDLKFLLNASQSISEEIKVQTYFGNEGKKIVSREKNISSLLNLFSEVLEQCNCEDILNKTMVLLNKSKEKIDIFTILDSKKTVKSLCEEKNAIDNEISIINLGLNKLNYQDTERSIAIIKNAFEQIPNDVNHKEIDKLKKEIKDLSGDIDKLKKFVSDSQVEINKEINNLYFSLKDKFYIADDDCGIDNDFQIVFDIKKYFVYGERLERFFSGDSESKCWIAYNPGSMARHTTWQLLIYLSTIKFILNKFNGIPLLPLLVIDNLSMPYDTKEGCNNYKVVYDLMKSFAKEAGIQIIITSNLAPEIVGEDNFTSIQDGLNPGYDSIV